MSPTRRTYINSYGLEPSTVLEHSSDEELITVTNMLGIPTFEVDRNDASLLSLNATRKAINALQEKLLAVSSTRNLPKRSTPKIHTPSTYIRPITDYLIIILPNQPECPQHFKLPTHQQGDRRQDLRPYNTSSRFAPEDNGSPRGYGRARPGTPPWTHRDEGRLCFLVEDALQRPQCRERRRTIQRESRKGTGRRTAGGKGDGGDAEEHNVAGT